MGITYERQSLFGKTLEQHAIRSGVVFLEEHAFLPSKYLELVGNNEVDVVKTLGIREIDRNRIIGAAINKDGEMRRLTFRGIVPQIERLVWTPDQ